MEVVYAVTTASIAMPGGYPLTIRQGTHWLAEDPVVKTHPDLFSADPRYGMSYSNSAAQLAAEAEPTVESATAAPGERRSLRRPA